MAIFPGAVSTDTDLYLTVNNKQTVLTGALTSGTTSIPVTSTSGFPASGHISIEDEILHYSAIADSTHFTADVRGADGTTAAAHISGTAVFYNVIAAHHNVLKDEIKAIEASLNAKMGTSGSAYTVSRAIMSDSSGILSVSSVTSTELGYVSGVTSAIQTQLGLKAPLASPTFTGTVVVPTPFTVGAVSVTATGTELNYVVGVTSAIQTQLGLKAPLAAPTFTGGITVDGGIVLSTAGAISGTRNTLSLGGTAGFAGKITLSQDPNVQNTPQFILLAPITSTGNVSVQPTAEASSRVYTIPACGADASFVMTQGAQTLAGVKTFSSAPVFSALTATTVPYLDSSKILTSSSVTPTELGYLSGVTSAIQTQLGLKAPLASPTFTGTAVAATLDVQTLFKGKGTATNDDAASTYIGEAFRAYVSDSAGVSMTGNNQYTDVTSITLTAGDWDISAIAGATANGATVTDIRAAVTSTSGNSATGILFGDNAVLTVSVPTAASDQSIPLPCIRASISGSTTYYLKVRMAYSVATPKGYGRISARRVR